VMTPALVRPRKEGGYEIISGHRRKAACTMAEIYEMPVIVRELDDDAAVIAMTDSNMQSAVDAVSAANLRSGDGTFAFSFPVR